MTTVPNSWGGVRDYAKKLGAKYPELVAAQWALESGRGKHAPGHNYFGLKGKGQKFDTKEEVDGKMVDVKQEDFLVFESLADSIEYLVERWYKDYKSYKGVNNASSIEEAAKQLKAEGYATDSKYPELLMKLVRQHAPRVEKEQPALMVIKAVKPTVLKKKPVESMLLAESQLLQVEAGRTYSVLEYREIPESAHAKVKLGYGAGEWYIYEPHWSNTPVHIVNETDWGNFDSHVSKHLIVGEVLQWDRRRDPRKSPTVIPNIMKLAQQFDSIRTAWGRPIGVTSFYRPEPINRQVGGVPNSYHVRGMAVDIYPVGGSVTAFANWLKQRWTGGFGDGTHRGFVHIDLGGAGAGRFVPGGGVRPERVWTY